MRNLLDLSYEKLIEYFQGLGEPKFRAEQAFKQYYNKLNFENTAIPKELQSKLLQEFSSPIEIIETKTSTDGTKKMLYKLNDGNIIEGVLMNYKHGNTLCVSTQVGCRMGCEFCASTKGGLVRNLTVGEILGQVIAVNVACGGTIDKRFITNVVLMGSGEPLDNYDNVLEFLRLVTAPKGINISSRNISLSTCGIVEKVEQLADSGIGVTLSVSLHSPNQQIRERLMPIAKKYNINEVVDSAKYYFKKTGRRVIFEYAAANNVNISDVAARQLADLVGGFPCHVNVIIVNPIIESSLVPPTKKQAYNFVSQLESMRISASLRRQMGVDIDGACGQLRRKYIEQI